jgi:hypothetical protein
MGRRRKYTDLLHLPSAEYAAEAKRRQYEENLSNGKALSYCRKHLYGVSAACVAAMEQQQNGLCAICLEPPVGRRLAVDHCHKTGEVRGLLCNRCNAGIGLLGDDPQIIGRAVEYLLRLNLAA